MEKSVWCMRCWLFLSILSITNTASTQDKNCKKLVFGGLGTGANRIEIEENNYINLTVHWLEVSRCDINDQNISQVKITYQNSNKTVDLCKFTIKTICELSDSSIATSFCRCLNNHAVQFLKKATSSDSRLYTWRWWTTGPEKRRDIFIDVRKANIYDNTATTASVTCVFLALVVATTVGVGVCLRHKAKNSREVQDRGRGYRCSRCNRVTNNQISSQADGLYHVDNTEPTASHNDPNYADVIGEYWIHNFNLNYSEVSEQNTSQLIKLPYFCGRLQDKTKSLDPSCEEVNLKKIPGDSASAHVKKPKAKISDDPVRSKS